MSTASNRRPGAVLNEINPSEWVARYADALYAYAQARLSDVEKARELVQETFLSALEKVKGFEGRSSELTWLTAILKHKIIDHYRRQSARAVRDTRSLDEVNDLEFFEEGTGHWTAAASPRPFGMNDDLASQKELAAVLRQCMEKLPALWLSVFSLRHVEDETAGTICSTLKITPANFWVIMHRAKVSLRACIQKNWV